mgnify:CR=1 FL=1
MCLCVLCTSSLVCKQFRQLVLELGVSLAAVEEEVQAGLHGTDADGGGSGSALGGSSTGGGGGGASNGLLGTPFALQLTSRPGGGGAGGGGSGPVVIIGGGSSAARAAAAAPATTPAVAVLRRQMGLFRALVRYLNLTNDEVCK